MSPFTDDDLERWKGYTNGMPIPVNALDDIKRMMKRLEAAEKAMQYVFSDDGKADGHKLFEAWRRSCDELVYKATYGPEGCNTLWERKL